MPCAWARSTKAADSASVETHRRHDAELQVEAVGGELDRLELVVQDLGLYTVQAEAAHAERWVRFVLLGRERQRLVGARVERPHNRRTALEPFEHGTVEAPLLVDPRRARAVQEQQLGTQQPDSCAAFVEILESAGPPAFAIRATGWPRRVRASPEAITGRALSLRSPRTPSFALSCDRLPRRNDEVRDAGLLLGHAHALEHAQVGQASTRWFNG
jgi:hypothetical protein